MNVIVNTSTLAKSQNELKKEQNYYQNKKSTFTSTSFGATGQLSSFLNKVNMTYNMIAKNIENISKYLEDYIKDIEGLENKMSNGSGSIKASTVSAITNKYRNSIDKYNLDSQSLFEVQKYKSTNSSTTNIGKTNNNNSIKSTLANAGTSVLSLTKGLANIKEAVSDKVGSVASKVKTVFSENAQKINKMVEQVKKDISGQTVLSKSGLDQYPSVGSSLSKIYSGIGTITGKVAIGTMTAGLGSILSKTTGMKGLGLSSGTTAVKVATVVGGTQTGTSKNTVRHIESGKTTSIYSGINMKQNQYKDPLAMGTVSAIQKIFGAPTYQNQQMINTLSEKLGIKLKLHKEDGKVVPDVEYGPAMEGAEAIEKAKRIKAEAEEAANVVFNKIQADEKEASERAAAERAKIWGDWRQSDERWGSIRLGSGGSTITSAGCLATSVAKLISMSGTKVIIDDFNPGTMVNTLNKNGGFSGSQWAWNTTSVAPNFEYGGFVELNQAGLKTKEQKLSRVKEYLDQGYYIVLKVQDPSISGNQHWVAVTGVTDNDILMSDPSSDATTVWSQYNPNETYRFGIYKKTD